MEFKNSNQYLVKTEHSKNIINHSNQQLANEQIMITKNRVELSSKIVQPTKSNKIKTLKHKNPKKKYFLALFFMISLIGIATGGYFIFREMLLNIDRQLILNCVDQKNCSPRITALENFVKAKRSLKFYNFYKADLKDADLKYADLRSTDLRYTNIYNVDLRYADLRYADLRYADLRYADLRYADLRYADLRYADLRYADLTYADLRYTDVRYANLEKADLRDTNLNNADLRYTNLENTALRYSNLQNANLKYTNLEKADLIKSIGLNPSQIKLACNWEKAIYVDYYIRKNQELIVEQEANQQYIKQIKEDQASDPQKNIDCRNILKTSGTKDSFNFGK